jgi:hypothetical protein
MPRIPELETEDIAKKCPVDLGMLTAADYAGANDHHSLQKIPTLQAARSGESQNILRSN